MFDTRSKPSGFAQAAQSNPGITAPSSRNVRRGADRAAMRLSDGGSCIFASAISNSKTEWPAASASARPARAEEPYQVAFVLSSQLDGGGVRVQVVVAVRQHGAALRDLDHQPRGIRGVDDDRVAEGAARHE